MVSRGRLSGAALILALAAPRIFASPFTITATFAGTITSDPNASSIEAAINSAIATYEGLFVNPINVNIEFTELNGGLGQSSKQLMRFNYSNFYSAYAANAASNNDPAASAALAAGVVPNEADNPLAGLSGVTNRSDIAVSTVDARALGLCSSVCVNAAGGYDGYINLNTNITSPGSAGSSLQYYLVPVVEHEIDEVLGLGSALDSNFQSSAEPEDLFRYDSSGNRSYTTNPAGQSFFTLNRTNDLAQFDNQADGGDWGDWRSNPLPNMVSPQVQDAFATPGADPSLGVEITALEAIGYDVAPGAEEPLLNPTPEPGTIALFGIALVGFGAQAWRRRT